MTDIIFCLVGPSGSGKTTIAKMLERDYNVIQSYTTRQPRSKNEWGHTFVSALGQWPDQNVVEYSFHYGNHYWTTKDQYLNKGKTIHIIEPVGEKNLRQKVDCPVVTIFLRAGQDVCYYRIHTDRGRDQALKRVEQDAEMFACVKTDYVVNAELPFYDVLRYIKSIIGEY